MNQVIRDLRAWSDEILKGEKPPPGFTPVPGSKVGAYHKKTATGWDYWKPGQQMDGLTAAKEAVLSAKADLDAAKRAVAEANMAYTYYGMKTNGGDFGPVDDFDDAESELESAKEREQEAQKAVSRAERWLLTVRSKQPLPPAPSARPVPQAPQPLDTAHPNAQKIIAASPASLWKESAGRVGREHDAKSLARDLGSGDAASVERAERLVAWIAKDYARHLFHTQSAAQADAAHGVILAKLKKHLDGVAKKLVKG